MKELDNARYAKQSKLRVRSGLRLVGFLLLVAGAAAVGGVWWLAKLGLGASAFFAAVTLTEHLNARRRERS